MIKNLIKFTATFGGLGFVKKAPGTAGCLGAAIIYLLLKDNPALCLLVTAMLIAAGFLVAGRAEKIFNQKDARPIVIDDACGFMVSVAFIPFSLMSFAILFLLFRAFDIWKPFPIKRVERLPGSIGVMGDDIIAGIYANLFYRLCFLIVFSLLTPVLS